MQSRGWQRSGPSRSSTHSRGPAVPQAWGPGGMGTNPAVRSQNQHAGGTQTCWCYRGSPPARVCPQGGDKGPWGRYRGLHPMRGPGACAQAELGAPSQTRRSSQHCFGPEMLPRVWSGVHVANCSAGGPGGLQWERGPSPGLLPPAMGGHSGSNPTCRTGEGRRLESFQ